MLLQERNRLEGGKLGFSLVIIVVGTSLLLAHLVDTQLIGDPNDMLVIKGAPSFQSYYVGLLESNPYQDSGHLNFININVFCRQVRNLVFERDGYSEADVGSLLVISTGYVYSELSLSTCPAAQATHIRESSWKRVVEVCRQTSFVVASYLGSVEIWPLAAL